MLNTNFIYTFNSTNPAPPAAGAYQTILGELLDKQGQLIGINQWIRTIMVRGRFIHVLWLTWIGPQG